MAEPSNPLACGSYRLFSRRGLDAARKRDGAATLDGSFFCLSETAAQMFKGTLSQGEQDTVQRIAGDYNADRDRVRADLMSCSITYAQKA
jgi:hypothetical protein